MRAFLIVCAVLFWVVPAMGREIAGVNVAEQLEGAKGIPLKLNGAGIRSKVFFKIYIAGLYLEETSNEAAAVLERDGQKRMVMHFLYDEVGADKLVAAWNDGFSANLSADEMAALAPRIEVFNAMFSTVKKGDSIELDYQPGVGTSVKVAGEHRGAVEGKDFSDALLSIWIGDKPVTSDLKKELLKVH